MMAPESAYDSSSLLSLKQEHWFAVAKEMDGAIVVVILLVGGGLRFCAILIHTGVVTILWMLLKEVGV